MHVIEACKGVLGIHAICHFTSEIWDTIHFTFRDTGYCVQYFVTFRDIGYLEEIIMGIFASFFLQICTNCPHFRPAYY